MDGQKIWTSVLAVFKDQVSQSNFNTWFRGSKVLEFTKNDDNNVLVVEVKNTYIKEQLQTRYLSQISKLIGERGLGKTEVVLVVSRGEDDKTTAVDKPLFSGVAPTFIPGNRKSDILNLAHTFGNFVVGFSNNLAYLAATQVASNLGTTYNPLFIYGPTGVGKTHLLQAIGNEVLAKTINAKVVYASAETFMNDFIESLRNKTQQAMRAKYRGTDLLLIDDVQFLAGKEGTQDEFFHTFNELYLSGRQIILACDKHPKELTRLNDRLLSRFLGGLACDVGYPDLEMKRAILKSKCKEKSVEIDDEIISFISDSCTGSVRELEGLLISVLSMLRLSGGNAAFSDIKNLIEKSRRQKEIKVSPQRIVAAVCDHFRLQQEKLLGIRRSADLVKARQVLMYLLRKEVGMSLDEIGQMIGGRDHSTIIYGIRKLEKIIETNQTERDNILRIQASI